MKYASLLALLLLATSAYAADESPRARVVVVVGAAGTPEYGAQFQTWAQRWQQAAEAGAVDCLTLGLATPGDMTDRDLLQAELQKSLGESQQPLWLVLIGHGTFDGKTARYNLRGPDITSTELQGWLKALERPLAIIDCTSCSGPFLAELSGPRRIVITATKTGHEYNFARFGDYLSTAIADPASDLDKDEQTSLLEAFLSASAKLREFYTSESRLATEHPLLDDNGDRLGTPGDWFQGLRPTKAAKSGAALDGELARNLVLVASQRETDLPAELRAQRDALEQQLLLLRAQKSKLPEVDYLAQLEKLLVSLARLYTPASKPAATPPAAGK